MKKKCQVVMLSINKRSDLLLSDNKIFECDNSFTGLNTKLIPYRESYQHLYILSDDEIKEGDWFIANQGVFQCLEIVGGDYPYKISNQYNKGEIQYKSKHWFGNKIIATTDKYIMYHDKTPIGENVNGLYKILPQPSPSFIQKYIEEWNKGNKIKQVNVEYVLSGKIVDINHFNVEYIPKVDKNNQIFITKVKDSWSREEVIELFHKLIPDTTRIDQWIEENL